MRVVRPGDLVFSYADALLQGVGIARSHCYTCPRPDEFGHVGELWDIIGWRVDVKFHPFIKPFRPRDVLAKIQVFLSHRDAPLNENGLGLQHIYLTQLTDIFGNLLVDLVGVPATAIRDAAVAERSADDLLVESDLPGVMEWEDIETQKIRTATIAETERTALVKARVGQGLFKENVSRFEHRCRITGVTNPAHLIASHIKPWRESTNAERLAAGNGLLLTPSIDHLFDRGFITFDDSGDTIVSPVADHDSLRRMGVNPLEPPRVGVFNIDQKFFLNHHRTSIFLNGVS